MNIADLEVFSQLSFKVRSTARRVRTIFKSLGGCIHFAHENRFAHLLSSSEVTDCLPAMTSRQAKVVIQNVSIFDGQQMKSGQTVAFEHGLIVKDTRDATAIVDGNGGFLIPGLIDTHAHVHGVEDLVLMARHGVTTCLDMGTRDISVFESLRGGVGHCDIRSAGIPAMSAGSRLTSKPGFPQRLLVNRPEDAKHFVADRISDGADYVKIMMEAEGPDQETANAMVAQAHEQGRRIVAHATSCPTFEKAVTAKVDIVTHVPLEHPLNNDVISNMKAAELVAVPTLVKMIALAADDSKLDYANAKSSAKSLKEAGVAILAGTDANKHSHGVNRVSYGDSMWKELELLVEVGLSPLEAVQSATYQPAAVFGLTDRGVIEAGKRADLILLSKNPLANITDINSVQRVWCYGMQVEV